MPRIYEIESRPQAARPPITVRPALEEEEEIEETVESGEPAGAAAGGRPSFRMQPGNARRPFGGRVITRDNMDVPAFMRKQMD